MPDSLVIDVDKTATGDALEALPTALERRVARENVATANRMVLEAKSRVHVRYGFLRDSIDWVQNSAGDVWIGVARKLSFTIPGTRRFSGRSDKAMPSKYAHLVERGTDHSPAYPFIAPAAVAVEASHRGRVLEALIDAAHDAGLGD